MKPKRVVPGFVFAAAVVLVALTAVPGAALARTDSDQRCQGPDKQFLVCADVTRVDSERSVALGGPSNALFEPKSPLPANEPDQCQPVANSGTPDGTSYVVGDTQAAPGYSVPYWNGDFSWAWQWDFYVDGGYWVVWDGSMPGEWPWDATLPNGDIGYVSLAANVHNWNAYYDINARMFWVCVPANQDLFKSARVASAAALTPPLALVQSGDGGEDNLQGDGQDNAVLGRAGDDRLSGGAGEDHLHGGAGDDNLSGGKHDDMLHGGQGDDKAAGGDGSDDIVAGKGNDTSVGGKGPDQLFDNQGRDVLRGGPGNDRFSTHDGARDRIDCGPGEDIALIDSLDIVKGCEHAYRNKREAPKKLPKI